MKASLRFQCLGSSTLFGPKIQEVSKCSREDLTRSSLQRATSQSLSKIKKKTGASMVYSSTTKVIQIMTLT